MNREKLFVSPGTPTVLPISGTGRIPADAVVKIDSFLKAFASLTTEPRTFELSADRMDDRFRSPDQSPNNSLTAGNSDISRDDSEKRAAAASNPETENKQEEEL